MSCETDERLASVEFFLVHVGLIQAVCGGGYGTTNERP